MVNGVQMLGTPFNPVQQMSCTRRTMRQLLYVIHLQVCNLCSPGKYTPSTMVNTVQILGTPVNRVNSFVNLCLPGKCTPSTMVNTVQFLGTPFNRVHWGVPLAFTREMYPVYHGIQSTNFGYTIESGRRSCQILFTRKMYPVYHGKQSTVFGYTIQSGAVMTVVHKWVLNLSAGGRSSWAFNYSNTKLQVLCKWRIWIVVHIRRHFQLQWGGGGEMWSYKIGQGIPHNLTRYTWPKFNVFCGGHVLQGMTCVPYNLRRFTMVDHVSYVLDPIHA